MHACLDRKENLKKENSLPILLSAILYRYIYICMAAKRCTFFGPLPLVYIPTVAESRRLSPIRDRKIRAMKIKFANALWPTRAKCACES